MYLGTPLLTHRRKYRYALAVTSQFYFCGIPFRLDSAPKCALDCLYCFAMARGGRTTPRDLLASPSDIRRKLEKVYATQADGLGVTAEMLRHRVPVHFGGLSDPFSDDPSVRISKKLLEVLSDYDYPTVLSTKNTDVLCRDDVLERLKRLRYLIVQVSISFLDERLAKLVEPGVPSPESRLRSVGQLSREGVYVTARLQPLFPLYATQAARELVPAIGEHGARHVVVEFLKLPVERNISRVDDVCRALQWDGYEFYRQRRAIRCGREWVLPAEDKWEMLQPVVDAIRRNGMTYGAGDYGLNHLGDTECCCGVDCVPGFSHWFKGNFSSVLKGSRGRTVTFSELADQWFPTGSIRTVLNSHCRSDGQTGILEYLRAKWNQPGTTNAPDSYLGVRWTGDYDSEGNRVYVKERVAPLGQS